MISVCGLSMTPVKATRLHRVGKIALQEAGVRENRRFYLVDERGWMVNAKRLGDLNAVLADYSDRDRRLSLRFPDGRVVEGAVRLGGEVSTQFYGAAKAARAVEGPWSAALSEFIGQPLQVVEAIDPDGAVDRGEQGAVSLISRASLERLASVAGVAGVDSRRFRMLIEIDGIDAHAEDQWVGRRVQIGEAIVQFVGHVGRCVITSRHPETGEVDLPTLKLLGSYRRDAETTEPVAFGIYGQVARAGSVALGDPVVVDGTLKRS